MHRTITAFIIVCLSAGIVFAEEGGTAPKDQPAREQAVLFEQLLRPGAMKEFAGKKLRFDALYFNISASNKGLPEKYKDHVRLVLCLGTFETSVCEGVFGNAVIAKEKSAAVYDLYPGQQVRIVAAAHRAEMTEPKPQRVRGPEPLSHEEFEAASAGQEIVPVVFKRIRLDKPAAAPDKPQSVEQGAAKEAQPAADAAQPAGPWEELLLEIESLEAVKPAE